MLVQGHRSSTERSWDANLALLNTRSGVKKGGPLTQGFSKAQKQDIDERAWDRHALVGPPRPPRALLPHKTSSLPGTAAGTGHPPPAPTLLLSPSKTKVCFHSPCVHVKGKQSLAPTFHSK